MKILFRFTLIYFILVFSSINAYASDQAEFSIFLFQKGSALSNAELLVDGKTFARFSENGSVFGALAPGNYQLTINHQDKSFGFSLPLRPQENVQVMLTFPAAKGQPTLTIESNISELNTDSNTGVTEHKDLGEGIITGTVISAETSNPVSDVQVFLSGLNKRYKTNAQGQFKAKVPVSEYSVSLLHSAYNTQTKDKVTIVKDKTTALTFKLTPSGVELAEYVVLEPFLASTLASVIEEQRSSSSVSTVLGSEQISRNGDSDVASALRRASGLTIIGGKFVFIRGLGERYSTTLINGSAIPSPDPTRRVVPLDLFPTTFIDSILVQKSYSVDRPGEFAGGTLDMRTKRVPDEFFVKFGA
jgi:hypothetical protein